MTYSGERRSNSPLRGRDVLIWPMKDSVSVIIGLEVATSNVTLSMPTLRMSVFSSSVSVTVRLAMLMPDTVKPLPSTPAILSSTTG